MRKLKAALGVTPGLRWKPAMDLHKIISELQSEKRRIDEAIQALERLSVTGQKTRKRDRPAVQTQAIESEGQHSKAQGHSS